MRVEIKGWDWQETAAIFGIDIEAKKYQSTKFNKKAGTFTGEEILRKDIEKHLFELMWKLMETRPILTGEQKLQVRQLRKFAKAIYLKSTHTDKPIFKGLCDIEDDATFIRWLIELLGYMWT